MASCTPKSQQKKASAKKKDGTPRKAMTQAHKDAIASSLKGKSLTEAHKAAISKATKGIKKCRS